MKNWTTDKAEETGPESKNSDKSTGLGNVKTIIADKVHKAAEALGEKAANPDAHCGMSRYGKQASECLDQTADCVREFDYVQAEARIREYIGQRPGLSLLIAGGVGLIIGAVLRRR